MNNMKYIRVLIGTGIISLLVMMTFVPMGLGIQNFGPELEIQSIQGGLGKVAIEIVNVGDVIAEEVVSTISVKGGLLNNIDIFKTCSGCGSCNNSIPPDGVKIESTSQFIFGLGSVDIMATANATGIPTVEKTATAFVIGPFVLLS
jgi:hypothetical protein